MTFWVTPLSRWSLQHIKNWLLSLSSPEEGSLGLEVIFLSFYGSTVVQALWQWCRHAWIRQNELMQGLHHLQPVLEDDVGVLSKASAGRWLVGLETDKGCCLNFFYYVVANLSCVVLLSEVFLTLCHQTFCSTVPGQQSSWGAGWVVVLCRESKPPESGTDLEPRVLRKVHCASKPSWDFSLSTSLGLP